MTPLVIDEIADYVVDCLAQKTLIAQDILDRLRDPLQTSRALPMFGLKITDRRRCQRVADLEFLDNNVLLRVMAGIRIAFEIVDYREDDLVVGAIRRDRRR